MSASILLYEAMNTLSSEMVEAARDTNWDRLSQLESRLAALREQLMSAESPRSRQRQSIQDENPQMADLRQRKIALIQTILANDREIRRHTEPWMASVRELLAGSARQDKLRNAYGQTHGS